MSVITMGPEIDLMQEIDTLFQKSTKEPLDGDVAVIILKIHHPAFNIAKKSYDLKLWGNSLTKWVALAFDKCPILELETTEEADVLQVIRPHLSDKKYTAVFYADTPLLTRSTFLAVMDYVKTKRLNVCKLERGYVFLTEYVKTAEKLYSSVAPNLPGKNEFKIARDMNSLCEIGKIIKLRILNYHMSQGVQITDESVCIDADVIIGKNVVIYPQNVLQGNTVILDNVTLGAGNLIVSSRIGKGSALTKSVIVSSDIAPNSVLPPASVIENGRVKK